MKKVLFVATVVKTHILEFHVPFLQMFHEEGWQVDVAARNDGFDTIPFCDNYYDIKFERNPFSPRNAKAYRALLKVIKDGDYDIIHCHTPVAGVLTRIAAHAARARRVIYTAHGFHFFKGAPVKNWILYYPVEKFLSRWTDDLITIVDEDFVLARRKFHAKHTWNIPGIGINIERFNAEKDCKKEDSTVKHILSVGEMTAVKNHTDALKAVSMLPDVDYSIAGSGVLMEDLKKEAIELGIEDRVHFLGYRNDVPELLKKADLFLFPSLREGLPVSLMEAIAAKVPCVAYNIRGCRDLLPSECLAKSGDVKKLAELIKNAPDCTEEAYENLKRFDISNVKTLMHDIYFEPEKSRYVSAYVRNAEGDPASHYRIAIYKKPNWIVNDAISVQQFYKNLEMSGFKKKLYQAFLLATIIKNRALDLKYDLKHKPSHVIIQRELVPHYLPAFLLKRLKKVVQNSKLIWDFDDDILSEGECSEKEFTFLKKNSSKIVVTSDYLNGFVDNKAELVPTTDIPASNIDELIENRKKTFSDNFTVLWLGTSGNLKNLSLVDIPGLHVVCNAPYEGNVVNIQWSRKTAKEELKSAHLGIMPLLDEPYNYGKGAFKLIQYMSVGLPVMASSVGFNKQVVKPSFGYLDDFDSSQISSDVRLWEEMSRNSFNEYLARYSYDQNDRFWTEIVK